LLQEVFWVMFNYVQIGNATSNDKKTNYFILKPNGCELGTAYGDLGQNFTATTSTPTLALGTPYQYTITKRGYHLTVAIDGVSVLDATYDHTGLYDQEGVIGLYCEDATVTSVVLTSHMLSILFNNVWHALSQIRTTSNRNGTKNEFPKFPSGAGTDDKSGGRGPRLANKATNRMDDTNSCGVGVLGDR
jgi:hypothetical protein